MGFISDLITNVSAFRIKIGEKFILLKNMIGNLPTLTTTHKTDIVGAINEVNQKQSDVKIGGRNYILNSKNEREQNNSTINENYIIYDISTTNSAQLEPNTIYTLTADLWMTANVSNIDMFFVSIHGQHHSKNNIVLPAQTWICETFTFITGNATPHNGQIRFDLNGSTNGQPATLKTRLVKLEKGNKASDWTPAPEDQYHENFDKLETVNQHVSIGSNVRFGDITATFGGAKIVYDVIENYGGVLKVNANGGLPLQLQNNGITTMQLEDYRVIINQKTFINRGLEVQGTSVNTDETKIFIVNQQNPKQWALSHGINYLSETTFSIGTYISGVYSWHMALHEGGYIETNNYGSSQNWYQGYNERITQFNITATTNIYTFAVLLANGVQKQATLQTNATHFTINGSGVLQLNAAIAQKINDAATTTWVQGELDNKVNQGGTGHQGNPIFLGWTGSQIRLQVDNVFIGYIATTSYVDAKIAAIPTHNGQLTVNTTADLVGGYVYLPSGNVTTTLGLSTATLNAIADGQTAYNWGNHAMAGYTNMGTVQNWVLTQNYLTASALNGYVLQSSLTAQLANYVTLGSVQTITATKTYTVSPIVPNGILNGHTVNLGQMQNYVNNAIANIPGQTPNRIYDPTNPVNNDYWDKIPINSVRPAYGFDVCNYEPKSQEYVSIFNNYGTPYLNEGILGSVAIMCPHTGVPVIKGSVESSVNLNPYIDNNEYYFCLRYYRDAVSPSSFSGDLMMLSSTDIADFMGYGNVEMFNGVIILGVATRDNTLMVQHREF